MSRSDNIDSVEPTVLGFSKLQWAGIGLIALSFMAMIVHWSLFVVVAGVGVWLMLRPAIVSLKESIDDEGLAAVGWEIGGMAVFVVGTISGSIYLIHNYGHILGEYIDSIF